MSSRAPALLVVLALAGATGVAAQDRAELDRRLLRLEAAYRVEFAHADSARREKRAAVRFDSIPVGPLNIAASPSVAPRVKIAAEAALARLEPVFGRALSSVSPRRILVIDPTGTPEALRALRDRDVPIVVETNTELEAMQRMIANAVSGEISRDDSLFQRWSFSNLSVDPDWKTVKQSAYTELVTSQAKAARDCFQDSLATCGKVLGIFPVENPFTELFSAEDRWWIVRRQSWLNRGTQVPAYGRCVQDRVDEACRALLEGPYAPYSRELNPLGSQSRVSLVYVALEHGRDGAYDRWSRDRAAPIAKRLEAASGMGIDSLLSVWHDEVIAAGGKSVALPVGSALTALGWCVMMAFAAFRSSRWR